MSTAEDSDSVVMSGMARQSRQGWERRWTYRASGMAFGPHSTDDLRAAAFLGFLLPNDLVGDIETRQWVEAGEVSILSDVFAQRARWR